MYTIRQFLANDSEAVRRLFVDGQREFAAGFEKEIEAYIRESLSGDLSDIQAHYLDRTGSNFWVVEYGQQVIGSAGLQRRNKNDAELRRMNVAKDFRRRGIAQDLLDTVEGFAKSQGYLRLLLSTITPLAPAIALYEKNGYKRNGQDQYGSVTVLHFSKPLVSGEGRPEDGQS